MRARKIPSALYVDFNNIVAKIVGGGFGDASAAWLAWLEDGQFDPKKGKRTFLQKRVYLGEPYLHFAKPLEANGFQTILSAADLIIALDLVESVHQQPAIKEYVLLSVDNDFQHLLERLGERGKARVATIEPGAPCAATFPPRAEIVFAVESLRAALDYQRPLSKWRRMSGFVRETADSVRQRYKSLVRRLRHRGERRWIRVAADHVAALAHETPGLPLGKDTVVRHLTKLMPDVTSGRFRSRRAYQELLRQMTEIRDDLRLFEYPNGGIAIMAEPRERTGREKSE
jgi:hypothetical protein